MILRRLLAALFAAALVLGLTAGSATATMTPTYTSASSGKTVILKKGTVFKVSLRTAADGGYGWAVTHGRNSADFTILSRRVVHPTGVIGGYSRTIWTIKTTHPGTDYFQAVERRSFEKNSVIARFKLTIKVVR